MSLEMPLFDTYTVKADPNLTKWGWFGVVRSLGVMGTVAVR